MRVTADEGGRVLSVEQAVEACAFGQAAAALVGNLAIGMDRAEAEAALARAERWLAGDDDWAELEVLQPARARRGRHGAILLPFRALAEALR